MAAFRIRIFMSILGALCVSSIATATELRVRFQAPEGATATIEKAELLLAGWGWTDRVALPVNGGGTDGGEFDSPPPPPAGAGKKTNCLLFFFYIKEKEPLKFQHFSL